MKRYRMDRQELAIYTALVMGVVFAALWGTVAAAERNSKQSSPSSGVVLRVASAEMVTGERYDELIETFAGVEPGALSVADRHNLAIAYYGRAFKHVALGDHVSAISNLNHAIELNPNAFESYVLRGQVLAKEYHRFAESAADLRIALRLSEDNPTALQSLGVSLTHLRQYDEALDVLSRARSLDPSLPMIDLSIGEVFVYSGRCDRAVPHLRASLIGAESTEQGSCYAASLLVFCYLRSGNLGSAAQVLDKYRGCRGTRPDMAYNDAEVSARMGDMPEAMRKLGEWVELVGRESARRRLDEGGIEDADGDEVPVEHLVLAIESQDREGFLSDLRRVGEQGVYVFRGPTALVGLGLLDEREREVEGERVHAADLGLTSRWIPDWFDQGSARKRQARLRPAPRDYGVVPEAEERRSRSVIAPRYNGRTRRKRD